MKPWRLIRDSFLDGPENMAVDEALVTATDLKGAGKGFEDTPSATLRLYGWKRATLSVGYMQRRTEHLTGAGVPIVRRITGGRAVLHHRAELTYSVVCAESAESGALFSMGISSAYSVISGAIIKALKDSGIEAKLAVSDLGKVNAKEKDSCFHAAARSEILVGGKKLVGSAQRRFKRSMLQHGSIIFEVDAALMEKVFGFEASRAIAAISDLSDIRVGEFSDILVTRMSQALGASFELGTLTPGETALKDDLLEKKYLRSRWNLNGEAVQCDIAAREVVNG